MNDLHALASFKALDEGRLQPVDKGAVVTPGDRKAACKYYGYDDEKELAYWGNVSNHVDVERLAKAFARHRHQSETGAALPSDGREALREALAEAYRKGATDVHNYWLNNPGEPPQGDPEFGEAASDYAHFAIELAALAQPVETGAALTRDGREALRRALRPFASAAKWWKAFDNQHRITTLHQHGDCLEVGHLRAAEAALAQPVEAGEDGT